MTRAQQHHAMIQAARLHLDAIDLLKFIDTNGGHTIAAARVWLALQAIGMAVGSLAESAPAEADPLTIQQLATTLLTPTRDHPLSP